MARVAFYTFGRHAETLRGRKEWFVEPRWPTYVAWWVADGDLPTWEEAATLLEHLYEHGPTPFAFSFRNAFHAEGQPLALDKERVPAKAATVR